MINQLGRGLRDLGQDLINIEVNTIVTDSISGRKMPSYPHALLDIAQKYADFLSGPKVGLNLDNFARRFCMGASAADESLIERISSPRGRDGRIINFKRRQLERNKARLPQNGQSANLEQEMAFMRGVRPQFNPGGTHYSFMLTNGWESFELLRWAANNILFMTPEENDSRPSEEKPTSAIKTEKVRAVLFRILRNCDQLKVVADDLRGAANGTRFIGRTRSDLVNLNEVPKIAPPHHLTRIRKIWDLGIDQIVFQTVVQLDGDVVFRASEKHLAVPNTPLVQAHEKALATGLNHWHQLFELVLSLITGKIRRIFDPDFETKEDKKKPSAAPPPSIEP
ncbi:MAG: hypothetical protein GY850_04195 [bacterium]|nr:hypothetical protein [bacterium]